MTINRLQLMRRYFSIIGRIAPQYSMQKAFMLFHTPTPYVRNDIEQKWLGKARRFTFRFEHYDIAGYRWGTPGNPKILVVHGWTGVATSMYCFIEALTQQGYEVISYDAIGHGESSGLGSLSTLSQWADLLRAMNNYVGEVEGILAHSLGGATVIVASKLGLQTKKIALIAPFCNPTEIIYKWFGERLAIPPKVLKQLPAYFWKRQQNGLLKYGKTWNELFYSNFAVPTLIIHDREDKEVSLDNVQSCCDQWTWAAFIQTQGLGHRRILYDATVVKHVGEFLNKE